jgi:hypothetical protein
VGLELITLVVIGTDGTCTGSSKSNYHMTVTMTAPCYSSNKTNITEILLNMVLNTFSDNYNAYHVPITTKVMSSNPTHGEMYFIQHYVIKFVSDLQKDGGVLWILRFSQPINLIPMILLKY